MAPFEVSLVTGRTPQKPRLAEPIIVGKPWPFERDAFFAQVNAAIDRSWLTNNGPIVRELEMRLAATLGVKHCICVSNGTMGLVLVIAAMDLAGEVLCPSFTFVGTAQAIIWAGLTPVFCDVVPQTGLLDPAAVERSISAKTVAIMPVHLWGNLASPDVFQKMATKHGLRLVFDAAHAIGCSGPEGIAGQFGDCEVFSLHATKIVTSGEGGAITTNDDALAERLRNLRTFGSAAGISGLNAKLSEPAAALGLASLAALPENIAINRRVHERLRRSIIDIPGLALVPLHPTTNHNYQYCVLEVGPEYGVARDDLATVLLSEGVHTRSYFSPHAEALLRESGVLSITTSLPVTEHLSQCLIAVPCGPQMTDANIDCFSRLLGWIHDENVARKCLTSRSA